jgi:dTMP kinase
LKGLFITFEGTEGSGKTTQVSLLADRLRKMEKRVRVLREPGGTPIGEEIRHTLQHSAANQAMTPKAELLLLNASRAQLVREVIRPALAAGEVVLCDRFHDSTIAYQGYGRGLDLGFVRSVIDFAVGDTRPDLTFLMAVPHELGEERCITRQATMPFVRDRMEEADREFFKRVVKGYQAIASTEPDRVRIVDATGSIESVRDRIWGIVSPLLKQLVPAP